MGHDLQRSYDAIAAFYAAEFQNELAHKPFDRKMLDWLIEKVNSRGMICDIGCGPGQIARYLKDCGAESFGIDLSPAMVVEAQRLNPDICFQQGDMLSLVDVAAHSFVGIAAFYCIIHIARDSVVQALTELRRILEPNGVLLLSFHLGTGLVHRDEWWGKTVSLDFHFFEREEMKTYLHEAGFIVEEAIERDPYADIEYQSRRAYIFARNSFKS